MELKGTLKKITSMLLLASVICGFTACGDRTSGENDTGAADTTAEITKSETDSQGSENSLDREINIAVLSGPTGMGAAKLMSDNAEGKSNNKYNFTVATAPDQVGPSLIQGTYDIAAVPTNLAATLYQKTAGGVKVAAVNTGGVLYILENGNTINSVEDLRGKKIYATGQASTPEYILNYVLSKNGIDPASDVEIEYLAEHSELAASLASESAAIGMLPEPQVTSALAKGSDNLRIALNLTEEWKNVAGDESSLLQGCIAVRSEFAESYPDVVEAFLKEYEASVQYAVNNQEEAAELIAANEIIASAEVAKKALPNCNIIYLDGSEMKKQLSGFLQVLYDANPSSIGGALPEDDFYYGAE